MPSDSSRPDPLGQGVILVVLESLRTMDKLSDPSMLEVIDWDGGIGREYFYVVLKLPDGSIAPSRYPIDGMAEDIDGGKIAVALVKTGADTLELEWYRPDGRTLQKLPSASDLRVYGPDYVGDME